MLSIDSNNRCSNETKREIRLEVFLILQLLLGFSLSNVCFLLGFSLHAWHFWASFSVVTGAAFWFSRKAGMWMLGLNALMFVLTLYTFTYVHIDASICHLPMSHFMQDGWNPVRNPTVEGVKECFAARGVTDVPLSTILHVLAGPKFSQILAAQLQSASGLFSAGGYPIWIMMFALAIVSYRFSRLVWKTNRLTAKVFAAFVCSNFIIIGYSFIGLVDYVTYSSLALAALSLGLWIETQDSSDLVLMFMSAVIALLSKFNCILCVVLLLSLAAILGRKERKMRIGLVVFLVSLAFFCVIPYWASAWHHGSPLYPAHSFRTGVPVYDLTGDFWGNDDACRMGYIARMVYAWVSKDFAIWGCKIWYSLENFNPQWERWYLTVGEPPLFCIIMWTGALLSLVVARNKVTVLAWVVFLSFLFMPVRYIGYSRYVSQVYFAVVLFWFNILCSIRWKYRGVLLAAILFASLFTPFNPLNGPKQYLKQIRDEGIRQCSIEKVARTRQYGYSGCSWWLYGLKHRFLADGYNIPEKGTYELQISMPFALEAPGIEKPEEEQWLPDFNRFPKPVWVGDSRMEGGGNGH